MQDRVITANVSIPLLGRLSGGRIYIEDVYPAVDAGRFPLKRTAGEAIDVWADIFRDGHVVLAAELLWRPQTSAVWSRVPMRLHENDRWAAPFTPPQPGRYVYAIEGWTDLFGTWRRDFRAKRDAGQDVRLDIEEGRAFLGEIKPRNDAVARKLEELRRTPLDRDPAPMLSDELAALARNALRADVSQSPRYPLTLATNPIWPPEIIDLRPHADSGGAPAERLSQSLLCIGATEPGTLEKTDTFGYGIRGIADVSCTLMIRLMRLSTW